MTPGPDEARSVGRAVAALAEHAGLADARSGAAPIGSGAGALHAVEAEAVAAAVPARRAEFAAGRTLLRRLLGSDVAIPVGPDRRAVLPDGWVGSLAHDQDLVVGVVVPAWAARSVGVDVERAGAVGPELRSVILGPEEDALDPTVAFCLKEAVYKAWSAAGGGFLDHHDVQLELGGRDVRARIGPPGPARAIDASWTLADDHVVALAHLPV